MEVNAPSVRIGYVAVLLDYFAERGLDPVPVLGAEWVHTLRHASMNERISVDFYAATMTCAIATTGDPALPLRLAPYILPRHLGILGAAAVHCANLEETALLLQRYERLIDDINDTLFTLEPDRACIEWIPRIPDPPPFFMQKSIATGSRLHAGFPVVGI